MFTKEYLQDRIGTLIINKKISKKKPQEFGPLIRYRWHKRDRLQSLMYSSPRQIFEYSYKEHCNLTCYLLDITIKI